jgi:heme-degrading monooxygenase HmoA
MSEQRIVSVVTFHVSAANFNSVREEVNTALQRRVSTMPGLIEATVLTNEQTTRLVVVSTWESRESWAVAQWDEGVDRTIADVFQDTASYDLEFFSLLARVEPKQVSPQ